MRKAIVNNPCPVPIITRNFPIFTLFATNNPAPIMTVMPPSWLRMARIPIGNRMSTSNSPAA
jgi:hypothetical protein